MSRAPISYLTLSIILCLAGCSQFPELDDTISPAARAAAYPDLVPAEDLRAELANAQITDDTTSSLEARVAALQARAARLRGTVIDQASRNRLDKKITINVPQ